MRVKFFTIVFIRESKSFIRIIKKVVINMFNEAGVIYRARFKKYVVKFIYYFNAFTYYAITQILLLPLFLFIISIYYIKSDLSTILVGWLLIQAFSYLLLTGFIYLLNRNGYANNLPSLSRFWKRSFMIFWLLEASLFACFTFLTLNEGQDLWVAKDSLNFFKTQHFEFPPFLFRLGILCFTIIVLYSLLISIESNFITNKPNKLVSFVICLSGLSELYFTSILAHCLYLSSYELSSSKSKFVLESRRLRVFNQFLIICSLAKFWHFVLVVFSWFTVMPSLSPKKNNQYGIVSLVLQNLIAIYFLTILTAAPYVKYVYRNNLEHVSNIWAFLKQNQGFGFLIDLLKHFYL